MSQFVFPNGSGTIVSSANTPDTIAAIFQPLITQMLGIDSNTAPGQSAVRIEWPTEGQPSWGIADDICFIRVTADDAPFSRVRDNLYAPNNQVSATAQMSFTQVWRLRCTFYGPNCYDRAREVISAMVLDWVRNTLTASNLYPVPEWHRPVYAPELFTKRWWKRADVDFRFNELVTESITVPTAAGVDVTLIKENIITTEFQIGS